MERLMRISRLSPSLGKMPPTFVTPAACSQLRLGRKLRFHETKVRKRRWRTASLTKTVNRRKQRNSGHLSEGSPEENPRSEAKNAPVISLCMVIGSIFGAMWQSNNRAFPQYISSKPKRIQSVMASGCLRILRCVAILQISEMRSKMSPAN